MTAARESHSLVVDRFLRHPPEKVWRALTQSWLIEEWLMANDFVPEVGHVFTLRATPLPGWSGITNCEVIAVEPERLLSYRWGDGTESASGLQTIVTWSLTPQDGGTSLRMEQSGFPSPTALSYVRLGATWPSFLDRLDQLIGSLDD
ncbi:SRPBCC domain-containing protein [Achromobacter aegrifaciens]|uniref:SRPBCC family protein n=1 Tax=Achromobacter aegrifaciens TaxID=1287736 RepID=UPI0027B9F81F|nr:SRPBCC domain-containing protein [Achromobacter aegrifaciens]WLW63496.1 SRPBCC domain-containing protein [Achromobacter aegrifaciens]